jgi:hypothetical protein
MTSTTNNYVTDLAEGANFLYIFGESHHSRRETIKVSPQEKNSSYYYFMPKIGPAEKV